MRVTAPSLVVLVGASGSGKTTFARRHFRPTEIVSSDTCRALVADDENALDSNREAFRLLHQIATARLQLGKLAVIDATNLQTAPRRSWVTLARTRELPAIAVVFEISLATLEMRAGRRRDRAIGLDVIRSHAEQLTASRSLIDADGFDAVHVVRSAEEADGFEVEREPALPVPRVTSVRAAATRWRDTWELSWPRKDVEAIVALYAPQVEYRALLFRTPDLGLDGVRRYLRENFDVEEQISCRFGEPLVDGDRAAVEWWASWIEGSRPQTLAGVTLLRFDETGLIVDHRDYWNSVEDTVEPYSGW